MYVGLKQPGGGGGGGRGALRDSGPSGCEGDYWWSG